MASSTRQEAIEIQPLFNESRTSIDSLDERVDVEANTPPKKMGSELPDPLDLTPKQRAMILTGLWTANFLSACNTTMVATLMSSIGSEFHNAQQASWLGTGFLLATCTFTPLYGRLSNAAGRRKASQTAIFFAGIGALACGLSTRLDMLILARFLAGLGAGGVFMTSSICVSDMYSLKERSLTQGYGAIFNGLGTGLGGPVGGWVSDRFGWRWAFLIQVPMYVVTFILITINLKYTTPGKSDTPMDILKRIDYWGSASLLSALGSYLTFLSLRYNEDLGWDNRGVVISCVMTILFFVVFILVELFVAKEPVLAPSMLRQRVPVAVGLSNVMVSICTFGVTYYLPMWFEIVAKTSVSIAGMHIMPNSVSMSAGSLFAGYAMHRTGKYKILNISFGILPMFAALMVARLKPDSSAVTQWLSIIPLGFGSSVVTQGTFIALLASIPHSMLAVGTGFTQLFRGIGQVSGVAVSSAVFQQVLERELEKHITGPGSKELIHQIRHSSHIIATLDEETQATAREAYSIALQRVFYLCAAVAFAGWVIRLAIPELPLDRPRAEDSDNKSTRAANIIVHAGAKPDQNLDRGLHDVFDTDSESDDGAGDWKMDSIRLMPLRPKTRTSSTNESDDGFDREIVGNKE